jgi:putative addiction module CopG family antidote
MRFVARAQATTMRTTQQFSITLPLDMAEIVEKKIRSGEYATVSEVVRDGVRALIARDAAVERWLREEVVPSIREMESDPSRGVAAAEVFARLEKRHAGREGKSDAE